MQQGQDPWAHDINNEKISYSFFFNYEGKRLRVCKEFYVRTLNIDAKRVRNAHNSKNAVTGTPSAYQRGKHVKKTCISFLESIRKHIESIPIIDSHYCRRETNMSYISGQLNLQILYEKYVEH